MTKLKVILKSAGEQEKKYSPGDSILKKLLPTLGYELFVGGNFDQKKNNFWYDPRSRKYSIDPFHNILCIHGGYMETLEGIISADKNVFDSSLDEKHRRDALLLGVARNLVNYLDENLDLVTAGKVQHVPILDTQVKEVHDDMLSLRKMVQPLNNAGLGTEQYTIVAQALLAFYIGLMMKYMVYQQMLEEINVPPHPSSL